MEQILSASDCSSYRHESAESTTTLHHDLPHLAYELAAPEAHPDAGETSKEDTRGDPDTAAHHEATLDVIEAGHFVFWKRKTPVLKYGIFL